MRKFWLLLLTLVFFALPILAAAPPVCTVGTLETCSQSPSQGVLVWVTDGEGPGDCIDGSGSYQHMCVRGPAGVWMPVGVRRHTTAFRGSGLDYAGDSGKCLATDPGGAGLVCATEAYNVSFTAYSGYIWIESAQCVISELTAATETQYVVLSLYYNNGDGTGSNTSPAAQYFDLYTATEGDGQTFHFRSLSLLSDAAFSLMVGIGPDGAGVAALNCTVTYYSEN